MSSPPAGAGFDPALAPLSEVVMATRHGHLHADGLVPVSSPKTLARSSPSTTPRLHTHSFVMLRRTSLKPSHRSTRCPRRIFLPADDSGKCCRTDLSALYERCRHLSARQGVTARVKLIASSRSSCWRISEEVPRPVAVPSSERWLSTLPPLFLVRPYASGQSLADICSQLNGLQFSTNTAARIGDSWSTQLRASDRLAQFQCRGAPFTTGWLGNAIAPEPWIPIARVRQSSIRCQIDQVVSLGDSRILASDADHMADRDSDEFGLGNRGPFCLTPHLPSTVRPLPTCSRSTQRPSVDPAASHNPSKSLRCGSIPRRWKVR